ncbi:MAG: pitrilysin family protein [Chloroflexota bacterium]|nr:pitrilysin family protein [Chloroflexota bacterium]MYC08103.1 insulinase family protein [Chloroflexota bacterium]
MFQKSKLDNGMRVVTGEMPHTRSVSMCVFVGVGSRYEADEQAGLSHFLEHMLFKGTQMRPEPQQISEAIESVGGIINAATEHEVTVYWCKVAQPYFEDSLALLFDMLRNSLYEPDSIEKERQVIFEELAMINDYPSYKVEALIDEMLYPGHPLGRDIGGTRESVGGITREMMLDYVSAYYSPDNIVVSVAGNVSHDDVVAQVDRLSAGWQPGTRDEWTSFNGVQYEPQSHVEYRRTEQAHLSVALPGVSLTHPQRYALDLMSVALGEGMSSRLFVEVREKRGLAYDVHSDVSHFSDTGALIVSAGVDPKRVYDAVQTILEQVSILREGVPEDELEKVKRLSAGRLMLRMEDTRAVAIWMGQSEMLLGKIADVDDVIEQVNAVTTDEILQLANEVLLTERLNIAVVGPCRGHRRIERMLRL